jgi:hypothetical protein
LSKTNAPTCSVEVTLAATAIATIGASSVSTKWSGKYMVE